MNTITDDLALYVARLDIYDMENNPDFHVVTLYKPHLPDNNESWQVFEDDDTVLSFWKYEVQDPSKIINLEKNKYPKGFVPLEDTFSPSESSKNDKYDFFFQKL